MTEVVSETVVPLLSEKCQGMRTKIAQLVSLEKDADLLNQLTEIQDRLQGHISESTRVIKVLSLLRERSLVRREDIPLDGRILGLRKVIEALQKKLLQSRTKLKTGNDWAKCDKEAGALVRDLEAQLTLVWRGYVNTHVRNIDGFQAFRHIEGCSALLLRLDAAGQRLRDLSRELPSTEADVAVVKTASAEMDALIAEIDLGDVPVPVQEFLRNAAQGGVSLASLTDEVLAYLRKRRFAESLRVTSGTSFMGRT